MVPFTVCVLLVSDSTADPDVDQPGSAAGDSRSDQHTSVPKALKPNRQGKCFLDTWWNIIKSDRKFMSFYLIAPANNKYEQNGSGGGSGNRQRGRSGCGKDDSREPEKYNLHNISRARQDMPQSTLANGWNRLLHATEPVFDFGGFEATDFHHQFAKVGENFTEEDVQDWNNPFEHWALSVNFPLSHIFKFVGGDPQRNSVVKLVSTLFDNHRIPPNTNIAVITDDIILEAASFDLSRALNHLHCVNKSNNTVLCSRLNQQKEDSTKRSCRDLLEISTLDAPSSPSDYLTSPVLKLLEKPLWSETESRIYSLGCYYFIPSLIKSLQLYVEDERNSHASFSSFIAWAVDAGSSTEISAAIMPSANLSVDRPTLQSEPDSAHQLRDSNVHDCGRPCPFTHRVYARVGVMGNPSDGFYGKTIALTIENFWAEVTIFDSERLCLLNNPVHDRFHFHSLAELHDVSGREGYMGGLRLLQAACKRFFQYCTENRLPIKKQNFTLSYETNIPRQVGLAGSSAIVTAVFRCLLQFHNLSAQVAPQLLAQLILDVETLELEIRAGLQDRVVQVYQGLVYMNFDRDLMETRGYGDYSRLVVGELPPLFIAYLSDPSDSGKIHSNVAARWHAGDEDVVEAMKEFARLTDEARDALLKQDWPGLGRLMKQNFQLRHRVYGEKCLGVDNLNMIQLGQSNGACCKFTGSGGAILGLAQSKQHMCELRTVYERAGFLFSEIVPLLEPAGDNC